MIQTKYKNKLANVPVNGIQKTGKKYITHRNSWRIQANKIWIRNFKTRKMVGHYVRSKIQWVEEGEIYHQLFAKFRN